MKLFGRFAGADSNMVAKMWNWPVFWWMRESRRDCFEFYAFGGLATGMDIDQIIADLMSVRRMPLDKLTQEKQRLEWQQEDYRTINRQLFSLRRVSLTSSCREHSM